MTAPRKDPGTTTGELQGDCTIVRGHAQCYNRLSTGECRLPALSLFSLAKAQMPHSASSGFSAYLLSSGGSFFAVVSE